MPHVARYFSQRAYDAAFEPCLKKSKTDHSASWEKKSVKPQEAEAQSRAWSSAAFSDDDKNKPHKSNNVKPGASDDLLSGADYVPLSGAPKHFSDDNKNKSYKTSHVAPGPNKDVLSGADFVPLSGTSQYFSDDHKHEIFNSKYVRPGPNNNFLGGADYVPLSGTSQHFSDGHKNEFFNSNNVRPGPSNDFRSGFDHVSLSGTSKHFSDGYKSYKTSYVQPEPNNNFLSGADYVPLSRTSKHFSDDHKNNSYKTSQVGPGPSNNFLSGADYVPLSGTSKHFSDDIKNKSYKSNYLRPGANNAFLSGADYVPLSGTSQHFSDGNKNKLHKTSHVEPGPSNDFLSGADYVPLSGITKHFSGDQKNESFNSNQVRPGHNNDFQSGADYVSLSGTTKHFSGDHKNKLYKSNHVRPGPNNDILSGADYVPLSGTSKHYSCEASSIKKEDSAINQHNLTLPKPDKQRSDSEVAFSETSTAFIGPLFRPPPQVELETKNSSNTTNELSSYKITTVKLGISARRSNGKAGIDYELRAFYKELSELETATDDQNIDETTVEHQQVPQCSNSPAADTNKNQTSAPQPCNSSPAKPSAFIPLNSHLKEGPVSPAKHPALPSTNHHTFNGLPPFKETMPPFVSQALPPPGFQVPPPPSFVLRYGPPPPRYDYPLCFPQEGNMLHPPFLENDKYYEVKGEHHRPRTQPPCHSSASPESRFSPQGRSYTKPFLEPPANSFPQEHHRGDHGGWRGRHFSELSFPQAPTGPHEQYSHSFRDNVPCTHTSKKLVLLRGVPGSGKSTLARTLLSQSPKGVVFSTDDYFCQENGYAYDVTLLGDAHSWNQKRARRAMDDGKTPIIIDNTNIQSWEMKPYVHMAIDHGYDVEFLEPDTWWKLDPNELEKRNTHRVPREKISQMLERYEPNMTVGVVMNSVEPRRVRSNRPPPEARARWGASVDCSQHSMSFHSR